MSSRSLKTRSLKTGLEISEKSATGSGTGDGTDGELFQWTF